MEQIPLPGFEPRLFHLSLRIIANVRQRMSCHLSHDLFYLYLEQLHQLVHKIPSILHLKLTFSKIGRAHV